MARWALGSINAEIAHATSLMLRFRHFSISNFILAALHCWILPDGFESCHIHLWRLHNMTKLQTFFSQICNGLLPILYSIERNPDWNVFLNILNNTQFTTKLRDRQSSSAWLPTRFNLLRFSKWSPRRRLEVCWVPGPVSKQQHKSTSEGCWYPRSGDEFSFVTKQLLIRTSLADSP